MRERPASRRRLMLSFLLDSQKLPSHTLRIAGWEDTVSERHHPQGGSHPRPDAPSVRLEVRRCSKGQKGEGGLRREGKHQAKGPPGSIEPHHFVRLPEHEQGSTVRLRKSSSCIASNDMQPAPATAAVPVPMAVPVAIPTGDPPAYNPNMAAHPPSAYVQQQRPRPTDECCPDCTIC